MRIIKRWLANWICKDILKAVVLEEVFRYDPKTRQAWLGDTLITENQLKELQADAALIAHTGLWNTLYQTLNRDAQERMFLKAKSYEDMYFGKAMLYNLDVQNKILELLNK